MTCQTTMRRDCDCTIHEGPHWLDRALLERRLNRRLLDRALAVETPAQKRHAVLLLGHWAMLEAQRMRDLTAALRRAGYGDRDLLPECLRTRKDAA